MAALLPLLLDVALRISSFSFLSLLLCSMCIGASVLSAGGRNIVVVLVEGEWSLIYDWMRMYVRCPSSFSALSLLELQWRWDPSKFSSIYRVTLRT